MAIAAFLWTDLQTSRFASSKLILTTRLSGSLKKCKYVFSLSEFALRIKSKHVLYVPVLWVTLLNLSSRIFHNFSLLLFTHLPFSISNACFHKWFSLPPVTALVLCLSRCMQFCLATPLLCLNLDITSEKLSLTLQDWIWCSHTLCNSLLPHHSKVLELLLWWPVSLTVLIRTYPLKPRYPQNSFCIILGPHITMNLHRT